METLKSQFKTLHFKDYTITEKPLAKGPISVVYPIGDDLVVKRMTISDPETEEYVKKYVENLPRLKYANLVDVKGYELREENGIKVCDIVMERAKSNLTQFMQDNPDYFKNLDNVVDFFIQMFTMDLLEAMKIAHRDLKPENILVFENYIFKLADSGLAHKTSLLVNNSIIDYLAPEILRSLDEGSGGIDYFLADVYSLGLLFLLVCGIPTSELKELENDDETAREESLKGILDKINGTYGESWLPELLIEMLHKEPSKRAPFMNLNVSVYSQCDKNLWKAYYVKTHHLHQKYAEEGNCWSMMEMGAIHSGSSNLEVNHQLSQEWFKKAAEAGCDRAKGYIHAGGDYTTEEYTMEEID